ncbi:MAG TPA: BlaI/MecI/CopY family transcriptional regulator [Clostridia bacterium]|nr:BlaI/MecI/CopY family transcriptional regulator [Clostridia bacterium]
METPKIFESEFRFCQIIWDSEPINSTDLVRLCEKKLNWKKSTTYTVLRRLVERGVLRNIDSMVTSLVSIDEVQAAEIDELVEKTFDGSLPMFISAFTKNRKLSDKDIEAIEKMIDQYKEK